MLRFLHNEPMDDTTDVHSPAHANENCDPFRQADTALDELYRVRREVQARDTGTHTFGQWRKRRKVLKELDEAISACLSRL